MASMFQKTAEQYAYIRDNTLIGCTFTHFKHNTQYVVVGLSLDTTTTLPRVDYVAKGAPIGTIPWSRPLEEFLEVVEWPDGVKRRRFDLMELRSLLLPEIR